MSVFRRLFVVAVMFVSLSLSAQTPGFSSSSGNTTTSDKVGIGTTTPEVQLHIAGQSTATPRGEIIQQSSDGTNSPFLIFRKSRGTILSPTVIVNGDSLGTLYSEAYDGTSYVRTGANIKFSANGTIATGSVPTDILFNTGSSGIGAEVMRITSGGRVGIGLTAPSTMLHIFGAAATSGAARRNLIAFDSSTAAQGVGGGISFGGYYSSTTSSALDFANIWGIKENGTAGDSAGALLFATQSNGGTPTEKMRIGSDGLVTIGTGSSSVTKLTVNGYVQATGFKYPDGTPVGSGSSQWTTGTGSIYYTGGSVGIGTSTISAPLTVLSPAGGISAAFTATGADGFARINSTAAVHPYLDLMISNTNGSAPYGEIRVGDDNAIRNLALLLQGGFVGIGTNNPSAKLQVQSAAVLDGTSRRNIVAFDTSASALGVGGGISFGGIYSTTNATTPDFANIWGIKENGTDNDNAGALLFATRNNGGTPAERMRIASDGQVTVGLAGNTGRKMTVNGDLYATGNISGGTVYATYQDVAEWVPAAGNLPEGTVVVLSRSETNQVLPSASAYDTAVAGVVSDKPGLLLGRGNPGELKIATTGRVKVRVDATKHSIARGDLLVTSERPGVAMCSEPVDLGGVKIHRPGTIIGKALEPLPDGEGEILVLLSLQ